MQANNSWNYRVLVVGDQEEIHNDFAEMLASQRALRRVCGRPLGRNWGASCCWTARVTWRKKSPLPGMQNLGCFTARQRPCTTVNKISWAALSFTGTCPERLRASR